MNKILGFDVSNNCCSVAVANGQKILAFIEELRPHMQAEQLIALIQQALIDAELTYEELDYLAVTNGPGSFTGIRIGLASAKGICLASKVPGIAITNFELSHYRAMEQVSHYSKIIILINAYRNQLYFQEFDQNKPSSSPKLLELEQAVETLRLSPENTVIAGSGLAVIYNEIHNFQNLKILPRFPRVKAIQLCRLADDKISQGNLSSIEPLYIRPPDAKLAVAK